MSDAQLASHLSDLVGQSEGGTGWRIAEIDQGFFTGPRNHIMGFSVEIESFTCLAKFSQDKSALDRSSVIAGLRRRATGQDASVADLVENLSILTDG